MFFPPNAVAVDTAHIEHVAVNRVVAIGRRVPPHGFFGNFGKPGTFDCRRGALEIAVDKGR